MTLAIWVLLRVVEVLLTVDLGILVIHDVDGSVVVGLLVSVLAVVLVAVDATNVIVAVAGVTLSGYVVGI